MRMLHLRVPDDVWDGLERLAAKAGLSVAAFATRELATATLWARNGALLKDLPNMGIDGPTIVNDIRAARDER